MTSRREGKRIFYSVATAQALAVMSILYEQFCGGWYGGRIVRIDLNHFTSRLSLTGGVVIGVAAAVLVMCSGCIAGISGIFGGPPSWSRIDMRPLSGLRTREARVPLPL